MENCHRGLIITISAPSGAGKSTICERLINEMPNLKMSISYTTRKPRVNEKNGENYYFIDKDTFQSMINSNEFIEWAEVYGNYYGTSKNLIYEIINSGKDVLLDIDTQGAKNIKNLFPESILIFIIPPSLQELERRLRNRGEDPEIMKIRLLKAKDEIAQYKFYDYLVVNNQLELAINDIKCIICSEKLKVSRINNELIKNFY